MALRAYHDEHEQFPTANAADESGFVYSWRVRMLPLVGHESLYEQYTFSESWDGPTNGPLCDRELESYQCPSSSSLAEWTNYVAVSGPHAALGAMRSIDDVVDGASRTIAIVETTESEIQWSEPRDLVAESVTPPVSTRELNLAEEAMFSSEHHRVANALFLDGSVRSIRREIDPEILRALLTVDAKDSTRDFFEE